MILMKIIIKILLILMLVNSTYLFANDEFINNFKIKRGFEVLHNSKKWHIQGQIERKKDIYFSFNVYMILPDLLRMDTEGKISSEKAVYDGKNGWVKSAQYIPMPMNNEVITDILRFRNIVCSPVFEDSTAKFSYKFKNKEKVGNINCKVYTATDSKGITSDLYISEKDTQLIRYSVIEPFQGFEVLADYYFYDYKKVNGVEIPFKTEVYFAEEKLIIVLENAIQQEELREFDFRKP